MRHKSSCTVLSHDLENDPDISSRLVGASAALTPLRHPILSVRSAGRACRLISTANTSINPKIEDLPKSSLDLVVAGHRRGAC